LGKKFEIYLEQETKNTLAKILNAAKKNKEWLRIKEILELCKISYQTEPDKDENGDFKMTKQHLPIKDLLKKKGIANQLKWRLGIALNNWQRKDEKQIQACQCGAKITQWHVERCLYADRIWTIRAEERGLRKEEYIRKIRAFNTNAAQKKPFTFLRNLQEYIDLTRNLSKEIFEELTGKKINLR
jgi:hypothetical protein